MLTFLPSVLLLSTLAVPADKTVAGAGTLTIQCPGLGKVYCNESTDPDIIGYPTTSGECDPNIPATLTYSDRTVAPDCDAQRFDYYVFRHWTATDSCGNTASCDHRIHVLRDMWNLDIKAPSCPNPFNLGANGMISMTIVGTAQNDVHRIDPSTIKIWTEDCAGGPVSPVRFHFEDKATPYSPGPSCACTTQGADGILDLDLHFRRSDVQDGLHLADYPRFTMVRIYLTARTIDGCGILAHDCVRVQ